MIQLPDATDAFQHENAFYLTCSVDRIAKLVAHYELFKSILPCNGAIVECGVYKGASLSRFAMFRELLEPEGNRELVAFDSFGAFPETEFEGDKYLRDRFVRVAGLDSISREQMMSVLHQKKCENGVQLHEGDICKTVPKVVGERPDLQIALLNLDVDLYEPSVVVLEHLFPRIVPGGILILDDYNSFPGETKAADDYFAGSVYEILPSSLYPSIYYVKKG
ncbi:class I SAM-dependent methyltransferase [Rhodothermus sp. AH-315-K08]|nr:class I SAM-dependent methyltransferase [Rhodothermus sp. AH-315-K08]